MICLVYQQITDGKVLIDYESMINDYVTYFQCLYCHLAASISYKVKISNSCVQNADNLHKKLGILLKLYLST